MRDLFARHDSFAEKASIPSRLSWGDPSRCPDPCVTVIMPVYRRPELFALALRSVLEQEVLQAYEVVVVDNNEDAQSPNQSVVEAAADPRVLYYRNAENLGMYGNWNRGIELARAPYVTFCHDDDLLLPHALRTLLALSEKVGKACILTVFQEIDGAGNLIGTQEQYARWGFLKPRLLAPYTRLGQYLGNISCGDGCLYDRQAMLETGGYDADLYPSADYALHIVYARRFGAWICNQPTSCYRKADNESMRVYEAFPVVNRRIHAAMLERDHVPRCLRDRFLTALFNNNLTHSNRVWRDGAASAVSLSAADRWIVLTAWRLNRFSHYRWPCNNRF